jgi:ATP-binding cassette subfamily F protein 3
MIIKPNTHIFRLRKDRRVFIKAKAYDEQQRMIADNRTFIDRFRNVF